MFWKKMFGNEKQDDRLKQYQAAMRYFDEGKMDQAEAIFKHLSSLGILDATGQLAVVYIQARGSLRLPELSFVLLHDVIEKLHQKDTCARASFLLGIMYQEGIAVEESPIQALMCYTLADELGLADKNILNHEIQKAIKKLKLMGDDAQIEWVEKQRDLAYSGYLKLLIEIKKNGTEGDKRDIKILNEIKEKLALATANGKEELQRFIEEDDETYGGIINPFIRELAIMAIIASLAQIGDKEKSKIMFKKIETVWLVGLMQYAFSYLDS